ncbi:MAG: hypothetical protein JW717_09595 [Marinilabiliaceae bacterium]|nr:hypothetical protein [Marinilabiliaceae bacterium]
MKVLLILLFSTSITICSQNYTINDLWKLYQQQEYEKVIENTKQYIKKDSFNIELNLILGRSFADIGDFNTAIPYLKFTAKNDLKETWRKAWALGYLGTSYFMLQNYTNSQRALNECFNLKTTPNIINYAYKRIQWCGFDEFYSNWKIVETNNFRFHFQEMNESEVQEYISSHENAFNEINKFFNSNVPKKIDFFVWNSRKDAKKILKVDLGFAEPRLCIIHSHYLQTIGHEMTHVISHYSTKIIKLNRFINEGTAVCFDQSTQNRLQQIKESIAKNKINISIIDYWENGNNYSEDILYPLSGLFVKELIKKFGRDKFIEFFSNQTYENAKIVFGNEIDKIISDFENLIN